MKAAKTIFKLIVVVAIVIGVWSGANMMGLFDVKSINISGSSYLKVEDVVKQSGVDLGNNLIKVNEDLVEDTLKKHPHIKEAEVEKSLFSKIDINITEREPVFSVPHYGSFMVIGEDGMIMALNDNFAEVNLPLAIGLSIPKVEITAFVHEDESWENIKKCYEELPADFIKDVSQFIYDNGELYLYTLKGMQVYVGSHETEFEWTKLSSLPDVVDRMGDKQEYYINLASAQYILFGEHQDREVGGQ